MVERLGRERGGGREGGRERRVGYIREREGGREREREEGVERLGRERGGGRERWRGRERVGEGGGGRGRR